MASRGEPSVERAEATIGVRRADAGQPGYIRTRVKVYLVKCVNSF